MGTLQERVAQFDGMPITRITLRQIEAEMLQIEREIQNMGGILRASQEQLIALLRMQAIRSQIIDRLETGAIEAYRGWL